MHRFYSIATLGDEQSWSDEPDTEKEGCCEDPYDDEEDEEREWCD
ncbi:MAG: hypothetical protein NTY39_10130 [Campylobacterales bacterium]|jgi:hypothetical protein|nr:hypothetical protein [Campylobacterales bacterium]